MIRGQSTSDDWQGINPAYAPTFSFLGFMPFIKIVALIK